MEMEWPWRHCCCQRKGTAASITIYGTVCCLPTVPVSFELLPSFLLRCRRYWTLSVSCSSFFQSGHLSVDRAHDAGCICPVCWPHCGFGVSRVHESPGNPM